MKSEEETQVRHKGRISRRKFMGAAATATAAFTIVPRHVLGGVGYAAPSETLNVACVGVGGMGFNNLLTIAGLEMDRDGNVIRPDKPGANIVALCDVDDEFAGRVYDIFPKAAKYRDFRKMRARAASRLVRISTTQGH